MTELEEAIAEVLLSLRPGDVVTYGQIAEEAGFPGRARAVGRVLSQSDREYAWWRVVNAAGRLVPGHERTQARKLRAEGVEVRGNRVKAADRR